MDTCLKHLVNAHIEFVEYKSMSTEGRNRPHICHQKSTMKHLSQWTVEEIRTNN